MNEKVLAEMLEKTTNLFLDQIADSILQPSMLEKMVMEHEFIQAVEKYQKLKWYQIFKRRQLEKEIAFFGYFIAKDLKSKPPMTISISRFGPFDDGKPAKPLQKKVNKAAKKQHGAR